MDKHYGFIYLTTDLKYNKKYIGQHKIRNQKTLDPTYFGSGIVIGRIIEKGEIYRLKRDILCFCESKEELNEKEKYYIKKFDAIKNKDFYNCAEGGDGGNTFAGKTIEEMEIIGNKISAKVNGEKNAMYGKNAEDYMTQEAVIEKRKNQSIAQKKRFKDKKEREKISAAGKKRFKDKKEREKISKAQIKRYEDPKEREKCGLPGEKNPSVKSVYCKELNIIFSYAKLAEEYCKNVLNSKIRQIGDVCNCKRKSTGKLADGTKLTWNWLEDVDQETLDKAEYIDSKKYEELLSQNVNDCK